MRIVNAPRIRATTSVLMIDSSRDRQGARPGVGPKG